MTINRAMRRKLGIKGEIQVGRSMEQIKEDYMKTLATAGDIQFRIKVLEADLAKTNQALSDLNKEAGEANEPAKAE